MPNVIVTGSNRGLGLEWVRQYAGAGWRVFATCRHPAEAADLAAIAAASPRVSVHRLDVTDADSVRSLWWELEAEEVDLLLNNAGIYLDRYEQSLSCVRYDEWARTFAVNTMGAVRLAEAFLDKLARGRRRLVVAISSHMGSIADIEAPGSYYYRSSKAALNAAMATLAVELLPRKVGVLILHPGGVRTRMGPRGAAVSPEASVRGMRAIVERFTLADTGRFLRHDGVELPW